MTKFNYSFAVLSLLAATAISLSACGSKTSAETAPVSKTESSGADRLPEAVASDVVTLKSGAAQLAGIEVMPIQAQTLPRLLQAPGEVKTNDYRSAQITTRVPAQVVRRHAKLGDTVKLGQPLVTLTSIEVAEAQGEAQLKAREWTRVQELGEAVVGGRRYTEARVAAEQARSKLVAYGLSAADAAGHSGVPLGQFTLQSPRGGTVLRDAFVEGQRIEPGRELFYIADESATWIEANLSPADANKVVEGGLARVNVDGAWLEGKVIQKHHLIDEITRTIPVRIEVQASGDHLHTGEFVDTRIEIGRIKNALAVPADALYQGTDGEWAVFVQEAADRFRRVKVTLKGDLGGSSLIEGVEPGSKVAVKGAFFLNSELAKASFGDE
jgi:cobalt-zinc-cadmium efflux system membrane fusion protein